MATIVEYTSRKRPLNAYPKRIVSPFGPNGCCSNHMVQVGKVEEERGCLFYYRRCQACGFTLRHFLPVVPPEQPTQIRRQGRFLPRVGEGSVGPSRQTPQAFAKGSGTLVQPRSHEAGRGSGRGVAKRAGDHYHDRRARLE